MGKVKLHGASRVVRLRATLPETLQETLRATSLIECVVASVIFLAIFSLSLDTLAGLRAGRRESLSLLAARSALQRELRTHADGTHPEGAQTKKFDWGEVEIRIECYDKYSDLQELTLTARVSGDRKTIRQKHIIKIADE